MREIALVARREMSAAMGRKSFVISTIIVLVAIVAASFIAAYFINRHAESTAVTNVGVSAELQDVGPVLEAMGAASERTIEVQTLDSAAADTELLEGDLDAWLGGSLGNTELRFKSAPGDSELTQLVYGAMNSYVLGAEISDLGGDFTEVMANVGASMPELTFAEDNMGVGTDFSKLAVAWAMLALLFFGIVMSGSLISMGVVEEKASRVVEILLATITPTQLFAGKVVGIGIMALGQILLYALAGVGAAAVSGLLGSVSVPIGPQLLWLAFWFLVGFFMFVVLWGGLSALAARQEDVGSVTAPMMFLLFIPFYTAMYLPTNAPNSTASEITSMAPFMAPFVMPVRQVFVDVPAWQLATAVVVSLLTIVLSVWLAARVYHRGVLHTGSRLKLTEALTRG
ncbi:MAG TPA: ABC transporter permease [Actinomycetales bacterium]|nr:ABC transporter permease [Actinomycetales bacterium]